MLRLSERNANIFADCNASASNIDFVKGVPSGQAFTSEGVLMLRETVMLERNEASKYQGKFKTEEQKNIRRRKVGDFSSLRSIEMTEQYYRNERMPSATDYFC